MQTCTCCTTRDLMIWKKALNNSLSLKTQLRQILSSTLVNTTLLHGQLSNQSPNTIQIKMPIIYRKGYWQWRFMYKYMYVCLQIPLPFLLCLDCSVVTSPSSILPCLQWFSLSPGSKKGGKKRREEEAEKEEEKEEKEVYRRRRCMTRHSLTSCSCVHACTCMSGHPQILSLAA